MSNVEKESRNTLKKFLGKFFESVPGSILRLRRIIEEGLLCGI